MRALIIVLLAASILSCMAKDEATPVQKNSNGSLQSPPNILLIVADDLGYSDLGAYGSEIDTPSIDSLASNGALFSNFYAHANCSPSRAMLFTGIDSHLAGLGAMHGYEGDNQRGIPGYEGHLNQQTVSFAKLLQNSGYQTYMTGKWHLGDTPGSSPKAQGFDRYFAQMKGSPPSGHFNVNGGRKGATRAYLEDGVDRTGMPVPDDFFSSNFYTSKLIEYIDAGQQNASPFFAYLAFSAPHIPVQAPESHIDLYKGRYDKGYDVLRQRRFNKMQELGLIDKNVSLSARAPDVEPWENLTIEDQGIQSRRMEIYAGAIDNLDDNVGRLLDYLRASNQLDNTLILFMSDNGAAGFTGWQSKVLVQRYNNADNSLENLGRDGSMMFYGPGWASASSTPFYLFKRHMSEGGIRVPFIISGPGVEHHATVSREMLTIRDVAPTLLDVAGVRYPAAEFEGRKVLPQTGLSFVRKLQYPEDHTHIHQTTEVFGWELFKRRAVRKGDWKAVLQETPFGTGNWQLYDLSVDPGETHDLAQQEKEKLNEMKVAWKSYAENNNVIISNAPLRWP
ncbi:MAG: arylsulfatase [Paraglaciecola polaris]|uniref:arylsulfatase n=1 Tax=Paraglaciecola polaris TaxID=222814 RepID=UPI0030034831|tara:strand:- start:5766 stop:7454 length:1689 start_codon:yes stop_codon:yes gene_type:complete